MVRYALNNGEWKKLWDALDDLYEYGPVLEWLGEKKPNPNIITINIETASTEELQAAILKMKQKFKGK